MGGKFQKRYDRLMTRACKAEAEVLELRQENQDLQELLLRYERALSQYKTALRKSKGQQNG